MVCAKHLLHLLDGISVPANDGLVGGQDAGGDVVDVSGSSAGQK